MPSRTYQKRMGWTLAVMALLIPGMYLLGGSAVSNMQTSPTTWVPEEFPKRVDYQWFEETFETNDALIMSWDGCTLDDPRLEALYQVLHQPTKESLEDDASEAEQQRVEEEYAEKLKAWRARVNALFPDAGDDERSPAEKIEEWVLRAYSGPSMIDEMTEEPLNLNRNVAARRLQGSLIGPDLETTCLVVLLTEPGVIARRDGIPFFAEVAERVTDVPEIDLHMVGPPVDATTIDTESIRSMRWFLAPSMLLTVLLCRVCLRSWAYTMVVVFVAIFGELLTLTLVYFSGEPMNAVLIVMPPLIMVLTVSAAVHLVNYYHDEVRNHGLVDAARKAMRNGRTPCVLATTTTAIGLLSLLLSDIVPVSRFGLYSTCGIVTTLVLLFLILPGTMERWPVKAREEKETWLDRFKDLSGVANFVTRYPTVIFLVCLTAMATLGYGLRYIQTSVNVTAMFSENSRILRDYRWFEKHLGPTVPLEVTLNFAKDEGEDEELEDVDQLDRLEIVRDIQLHIENIEGLSGTSSAATFFADIVDPAQRAPRRIQARKLGRALGKFDDINYLVDGENKQSWRISGRVAALGRIDYGQFLSEIQNQIDPRLMAYDNFWQIENKLAAEDVEPEDSKVVLVGVSSKEKQRILDLLVKLEESEQAREPLTAEEIDPASVYAEQLIDLLLRKDFAPENILASEKGKIAEDSDNVVAVVRVRDTNGLDIKQTKEMGALLVDGRSQPADPDATHQHSEDALSATYTGVMPLAYEVQRALLNDLIVSFGTAVALVSVVMMFVVRSPIAGLISMLPNVFPMVLLFGLASWRRSPVDIGSVMTASVALGIAVDDTLHFLTWFTKENQASGDKKAAVKLAFGHCAKAMAQTTLICGCGLAVYSFSWFVPTQRFAWMMITLLLAALIGDLLMLPAMLASPVGKLFPSRGKSLLAEEPTSTDEPSGDDVSPASSNGSVAETDKRGEPVAAQQDSER